MTPHGLPKGRITGQHGHRSQSVIFGLLRAAQSPNGAFEIIEELTRAEPELGQLLIRASNTAGRRGITRVDTVRGALVRLGVLRASRLLLETTNKADPTVFDRAA
ncbi:MAG: HDOD domain-containing protein [Sandaracinaceae bacterium]